MKQINIYSSKEEAISKAALLFTKMGRFAIQERGIFHAVLAGGETPRKMYEELAQHSDYQDFPWEKVHIYWGDERCVLPDHPLSNQKMVREALLKHVDIPEANIHPMAWHTDGENSAKDYEQRLRSLFGEALPQFDLILLGLGDDGHTASLFPNTTALSKDKEWVSVVSLVGQEIQRITLTFPVLNHGKNIVFLVTGAKKAWAVQAVLEKKSATEPLPAQLIKPLEGQVYWILDQEAGTLLTSQGEKCE